MNLNFREIVDDFVSLFYPDFCEACHNHLVKGEELICSHCLADLPRCNYRPIDNPVINRFRGRLALAEAHAFLRFRKKGKVQKLLHALKYKNGFAVGHRLGYVFGMEMMAQGYAHHFEMIVPVPLHASRLRRRGYNQSEAWASGLSEALKIPVEPTVVERVVKTETQTRRTKLNRWENVQGVFKVTNPARVKDHSVLLVDDVVTTGATLEACGQELLSAKCKMLGIACIAFAQ